MWGRPGNQGPFGQPPTERPTETINTGGPAAAPPPAAGPPPGQTERIGTPPPNMQRPDYPPPPPIPPAGPTETLATPGEEPAPGKKKRRFLRDPLSVVLVCIIVVCLVIAGLVGAELYVRHVANTKVAEAVACEVKDQATASFGVAPLMLWQQLTKHYTNISVSTAGNQIRDAKGMKIDINIRNVQLKNTPTPRAPSDRSTRPITWTSDGIKQIGPERDPGAGPFVTNTVTTHPNDGTIELKGMLDNLTAKPVVSGTGLQLQIVSFNALGFTMPKESVQSTLDDFTSNSPRTTRWASTRTACRSPTSGVTSHFSTQNATIPTGQQQRPLLRQPLASAPATMRARRAVVRPLRGAGLQPSPSSTARVPDRPSRVAPASSIASASAAVRMPPLALTPSRPPTVWLITATARTDAPPAGWNPVEVLTKSAPASSAARHTCTSVRSSAPVNSTADSTITFSTAPGDGARAPPRYRSAPRRCRRRARRRCR